MVLSPKTDLLYTSEAEILEGLADHGVTQVRRITIKKDSSTVQTKHIILTFNNPKLPTTIKACYLNCKIRPHIPNHLRCFKCQRFGHSQTSCRGQLTCSSEHSNAPENPKCVKRSSRNRRKHPKVQKPEIEIKMAPHRPRKSTPTEYATDEEDIITYDVEEEELEPKPTDKFVMGKFWRNNPDKYLRAITPMRFTK
ncbi:uncharacterized protein TNCV_1789751 [Trichonephila clavipes]|nr:uncharacterized protein TNCV_1789751 [Trichonephila clavipes]